MCLPVLYIIDLFVFCAPYVLMHRKPLLLAGLGKQGRISLGTRTCAHAGSAVVSTGRRALSDDGQLAIEVCTVCTAMSKFSAGTKHSLIV